MKKIELKKLENKKYYLNIFQGNDDIIFSNGSVLDRNDLYELYMKLRDIFTTNNDKKN